MSLEKGYTDSVIPEDTGSVSGDIAQDETLSADMSDEAGGFLKKNAPDDENGQREDIENRDEEQQGEQDQTEIEEDESSAEPEDRQETDISEQDTESENVNEATECPTELETADATVTGRDGSETVAVTCAVGGISIANTKIEFIFSDGSLVEITGVRSLPERTRSAAVGDGKAAVSTALVSFLQAARDRALGCTEITRITAGYYMFVSAFGEGELVPVWQIDTDVGTFYVNNATGGIL